jgi:hypothetical protein
MKINKAILNCIKTARKSATLENCGVDKIHQREMKIYLNTWVVDRLNEAINMIEDETTDRKTFNHYYKKER